MTEAQLKKKLEGKYGDYMYAHEVAEHLRKSKSRIGGWLEERGVEYLQDGACKKYYSDDVAKAISSLRVAGYMVRAGRIRRLDAGGRWRLPIEKERRQNQ